MRVQRWFALAACVAIAACSQPPPQKPSFIDLSFPIQRSSNQGLYPHAVDASGALWYITGNALVRQADPMKKTVLRDDRFRSGNVFWYAGAIYVLDGDGNAFTRVDNAMHETQSAVPDQYAPVEGIIADDRHRALVAVQRDSATLAVVDVWKWYEHRVPAAISAFAASLAGGAHGKKFLVVGDRRRPSIAIQNRWTQKALVVALPGNGCFTGSQALAMPVDVRGRDLDRTWATTGTHVVSVDLNTKKVLRVWDVDGCALQIVSADANGATVVVARTSSNGYESRLVRVDRPGIHELERYGTIAGLVPRPSFDRFDRLWWFDASRNAFICRTPL